MKAHLSTEERKKLKRASEHAAKRYSISGRLKEGKNAPKKITLTRAEYDAAQEEADNGKKTA